MEFICIDVKGYFNLRFIVLVCYRFLIINKLSDFFFLLYFIVEILYNIRNELFIIGDLNFNMFVVGNFDLDFYLIEFCDCFCMINVIIEFICIINCFEILIDFIFISNLECFVLSGIMKLGFSDYDLIYIICKQKIVCFLLKFIEYWSMRSFDKDCYVVDFGKIFWDLVYIYDDIDDIYEYWYYLFINVVDQYLLFKKKFIRGDQLFWIIFEVFFVIFRCNIFFRKFKRNLFDDNWN